MSLSLFSGCYFVKTWIRGKYFVEILYQNCSAVSSLLNDEGAKVKAGNILEFTECFR